MPWFSLPLNAAFFQIVKLNTLYVLLSCCLSLYARSLGSALLRFVVASGEEQLLGQLRGVKWQELRGALVQKVVASLCQPSLSSSTKSVLCRQPSLAAPGTCSGISPDLSERALSPVSVLCLTQVEIVASRGARSGNVGSCWDIA